MPACFVKVKKKSLLCQGSNLYSLPRSRKGKWIIFRQIGDTVRSSFTYSLNVHCGSLCAKHRVGLLNTLVQLKILLLEELEIISLISLD